MLEIDDVHVGYGRSTVLHGVSASVPADGVAAVMGHNGAGKSTLLRAAIGLLRPARGTIRLAGEDITRRPTHERVRRGIARTFQRLEAFGSLTVRENVLVAAEIHRRHAVRRSRHHQTPAGVADRLIERVGLDRYADRPADTVPTGIARLLELARGLASEPRLLLLDEPSSGLSTAETESFGELLRELAGEGRAVLIVEHDMDLIMRVCDRVNVLNFGAVIASGTPADVRADAGVQQAYLGTAA